MSEWWSVPTDSSLEQGDLFFDVPVVVSSAVPDPTSGEFTVEASVELVDAVVVTQTCDLENEKVRGVLMARVLSWEQFAAAQIASGNEAVRSGAYAENLIRGNLPPLTLLHARGGDVALPWSVVDFREVFTVDRSTLSGVVAGNASRLRLVSPYKEHFAQAFARFFMRVGLPHDAAGFSAAAKALLPS